jgi:hypothetical protein
MSSWLAFHMLGLYPNAGQSYYLLHAPLIPEWTLKLCNGNTLKGVLKGKGTHFEKVTFNGQELKDARIEHADLMQGGELAFYVSAARKAKAGEAFPRWEQSIPTLGTKYSHVGNKRGAVSFTLNKQYRTWPLAYDWQGDTLWLTCKETTYKIARSIVEQGTGFSWDIPADGAVYDAKGTFCFISKKALRELQEKGSFVYDSITWRKIDQDANTIHVRADIDQTEMWISLKDDLPLVLKMKNNPLGIDWLIER